MKSDIVVVPTDGTWKSVTKQPVFQFAMYANGGKNPNADGSGAWSAWTPGYILGRATYLTDNKAEVFIIRPDVLYIFKEGVKLETSVPATDPVTGAAQNGAGQLAVRLAFVEVEDERSYMLT